MVLDGSLYFNDVDKFDGKYLQRRKNNPTQNVFSVDVIKYFNVLWL